MSRVAIELSDSIQEVVIKMSEGVPGAIHVLVTLLKEPDGLLDILSLDDMNIRGSQIWIAWKDHCKGDLPTFLKAIKDRDPDMVATLNKASPTSPRARMSRFDV